MTSLLEYTLREEYTRVEQLGDKLSQMDTLIDWSAFRSIVGDMYENKSKKGGRPNTDEVVMIKLLVLQEWHGLSDPELERQVTDRISFRKFLGFPEAIPDYSTVWYFRERLEETGKAREIWRELQRQLDEKGLKVRKGVIQDATFITADPGHAKADTPRGGGAKTRRRQGWHMDKEGQEIIFRV